MSSELPVVECFHSIQGEGAHTGKSAFFIRLASCNVGCKWCDTKHSWSIAGYPIKDVMDLSTMTANAHKNGAEFVVITGGEPLHHNLDNLSDAIRSRTSKGENNSMPIHIETSGVDPISGTPSWITLSPKRHAPPRIELIKACNELKVISIADTSQPLISLLNEIAFSNIESIFVTLDTFQLLIG